MPAGLADSASPGTTPTRLPTNPRRRKIPVEQRKRVVRACNACNVKRIKCSGTQPCSQCTVGHRTCEYPPERQKITIYEETYKELLERCALLQRCLADVVPSEKDREALLVKWANPTSTISQLPRAIALARLEDEDQENPGDGRILQDPDGYIRYLGESSGAAFIDRLREFIATVLPLLSDKLTTPFQNTDEMFTSLIGRYHTHDSKPLLLPQVDPFYIPEPDEISKLLSTFQFYAQSRSGSPNGGIYYWGNIWELEEQARRYANSSESTGYSRILANLNAVLALACQYDPSLAQPWEIYPGETYFARAKLLLINPMEDASHVNTRILSLMGQFMLGLYRRDASYLYIGLAGRTAVIHGLHKGWMIEGQGEAGEKCKREFWNIYILDRWLSCLMGRPAMIPEEAVEVGMPMDIPGSFLPPSAGLRAHVELSIIMDNIINKVYSTSSSARSVSETIPRVDDALQKLSSWLAALPPSLELPENNETADRACLLLHMMYNQLIVLCTRPLLFVAVKQSVATKYISLKQRRPPTLNTSYTKCCTDAARRNAQLTHQLLANNRVAPFSVLDYHYAFTAGVILELSRLIPTTHVEDDTDNINFLLDYLCKVGDKGNESARDCASMVMEIGAVVSRLLVDHEIKSTRGDSTSSAAIIGQSDNGTRPEIPPQHPTLTPGHDSSPATSLVNMDVLPEGQSAAYQELFSWFQDTTF